MDPAASSPNLNPRDKTVRHSPAAKEGSALPRGLFRDRGPEGRLYLRPLLENDPGGPRAFANCEVLLSGPDGVGDFAVRGGDLRRWAAGEGAAVAAHVDRLLETFAAPPPSFAGVALDRPRLMGVVNVTPDSFTDNGAHRAPADAIAHGKALIAAGADIIDVGGESTRPGAEPVDLDEELARVLPVIEGLRGGGAFLSVDTRKANVMRAATASGAAIINDVSALADDPDSLSVAAETGAAIVLGHMRGEPKTMNRSPAYRNAPIEVYNELAARIEACLEAGIAREHIAVDPGFGFAKSRGHNCAVLERLSLLHGLGCALCVGASGKWFAATGDARPNSLAAGLEAARQGARILRVHDVAAAKVALAAEAG
jgi:dihydropteroate synthase